MLSNNIYFHEVHVPEYALFHYQPYELALSSKLVDTVKLHGIDLLHVHYAIPHAYAGYMAKKMLQEDGIFIPMITTLHRTDITLVGKHPFYKPAVTFSINKSDIVTSVSQNLKDATLDLFTIENDIEVIPNFIDVTNYDSTFTDCQRSLMAKDNERIITHISNFRKVKRIPDVIKIFHKIQKKIPAKLAQKVAESISIPVIGIGAGHGVDGQVLVLHDMIGMTHEFSPRFLRRYMNLYEDMTKAIGQYVTDVKAVDFPNANEQY